MEKYKSALGRRALSRGSMCVGLALPRISHFTPPWNSYFKGITKGFLFIYLFIFFLLAISWTKDLVKY